MTVAMISSTARDLPEHREKVMHACLRSGMIQPEMMEHLSAENAPWRWRSCGGGRGIWGGEEVASGVGGGGAGDAGV